MPWLSYEFSHKNYGTKPIPFERVCNPEHFDMRLETTHLLQVKTLCFCIKISTTFLEQNLYQSKEFSILSILICVLRLSTLWFPSYGSMVLMALPILLIKKHRLFGTNISGTIRCIVSRRISKCSELKTLSIGTGFVPKNGVLVFMGHVRLWTLGISLFDS